LAPHLDTARVREAWRAVMESGDGVAGGLRVLLRSVPVHAGPDRSVVVELAPDSPARERLQAAPARRALQEALSRQLGGDVAVSVELATTSAGEGGATAPPRITAELARQERMKHLSQQEPLLAEAVQEWDLDLVD
jgi:hypothetical protein